MAEETNETYVTTPLQMGWDAFSTYETTNPGSLLNTVSRSIGDLGPAGTMIAAAGGVLSFSKGSGALKALATTIGLGMAIILARNNGVVDTAKNGLGAALDVFKTSVTPIEVAADKDVEASMSTSMTATEKAAADSASEVTSQDLGDDTPVLSEDMVYS